MPGLLSGLAFTDWIAVLRRVGFAVDAPYWLRAALLTLTSLWTSGLRRWEARRFGAAVHVMRVAPPLFVLGHWRSGSTHLHNLLALDARAAAPNLYQVLNPHTFLTTEAVVSRLLRPLLPNTRPMDNMALTLQAPQEDEFALVVATLGSPYLGLAFYRHLALFEPYLTFRGVADHEIIRWKAAYLTFLKKLTYKHGKPLVLKSPANTGRIGLLLEMFPDARFVHIHRHPYTVFQSTRHLLLTLAPFIACQRVVPGDLDARILRLYTTMYDAFFDERRLIPHGRFHEVGFEDLERTPMEQMRSLYDTLRLPDFDVVKPAVERYVDSLAGYAKNVYLPLTAELRRDIARAWRRSFTEWNYSPDDDAA